MAAYWNQVTRARTTRRRLLAGTAAAGAGAAFLAACGGGSSDKATKDEDSNKSSLVFKPVDTTKQAKRGGTWKWYQNADIVGLDPYFTSGASNHYSRLIY